MSFGGLLLLVLLGTLGYGVFQFLRAGSKSREAVQTTVYIILYPVAAYAAWVNKPPAWLAVPVIAAGLPWLVAGIHLNEIVKDPGLARSDQFVGFPYRFWLWGGALSVLLGVLLG